MKCPDFVAQENVELHPDIRRFEAGSENLFGLVGMRAGIEMILELGVENIAAELLRKRAWLVPALQQKGYVVLHASAKPENQGGVIAFHKPGEDMVFFDTVGTLVGVGNQAGLMREGKLPRAKQAFVSDALGTVAGAALGTSTVTSFIESAAGVEQGGRTGMTALTAALLFLAALFFSPIIAMVGSYPAVTAPALVLVGSMMMRNVLKIKWDDFTEAFPAFLVLLGIPLTYSIADGLALGFISHTLLKLFGGRRHEVRWFMAVVNRRKRKTLLFQGCVRASAYHLSC